jgi:hypothetical protein|eukprot:COSAG01_NODE_10946_length_2041_cov_2.234809_2_plen_196_part_00
MAPLGETRRGAAELPPPPATKTRTARPRPHRRRPRKDHPPGFSGRLRPRMQPLQWAVPAGAPRRHPSFGPAARPYPCLCLRTASVRRASTTFRCGERVCGCLETPAVSAHLPCHHRPAVAERHCAVERGCRGRLDPGPTTTPPLSAPRRRRRRRRRVPTTHPGPGSGARRSAAPARPGAAARAAPGDPAHARHQR